MIQKGKTFKTSNSATRCRLDATRALSYDCDFMILKWSLRGLLRGLTRRRWPSTRAARRTTLTDSVARRAGANKAKTLLLVHGKLRLGRYRFVEAHLGTKEGRLKLSSDMIHLRRTSGVSIRMSRERETDRFTILQRGALLHYSTLEPSHVNKLLGKKGKVLQFNAHLDCSERAVLDK